MKINKLSGKIVAFVAAIALLASLAIGGGCPSPKLRRKKKALKPRTCT